MMHTIVVKDEKEGSDLMCIWKEKETGSSVLLQNKSLRLQKAVIRKKKVITFLEHL